MTITPKEIYPGLITAIGAVFMGLRLWVRYFQYRAKVDGYSRIYVAGDVFMVIGFAFTLAYAVETTRMETEHVAIGGDAAFDENTTAWLIWMRRSSKRAFEGYILWNLGLYNIKNSLLCYYHDAASNISRRLYFSFIIVAFYNTSVMLASLGYHIFRCLPVSNYWSLTPLNCHIRDTVTQATVHTSAQLSSDLAIMLLGLIVVYYSGHLQGKIMWAGAAFITLLGIATMIISCIRYAVSLEMTTSLTAAKYVLGSESSSRYANWVSAWALAEMNVALLVVAIPSLRVWWRKRESSRTNSPEVNVNVAYGAATGGLKRWSMAMYGMRPLPDEVPGGGWGSRAV